MAFNNKGADIIGNLRAANLILLLLNADTRRFPLDPQIEQLINKHSKKLEEMLNLVCEVCHANPLYDEMRSAIECIRAKTRSNCYDENRVQMLLTLFRGIPEHKSFNFGDSEIFQQELSPILKHTLEQLISSLLWVRVAYYGYPQSQALKAPTPILLEYLSIVNELIPFNNLKFEPASFLRDSFQSWLNVDNVQKSLIKYRSETNGLTKVVDELKALA